MANEAVIIELGGSSKGNPTTFTVGNTTGIEKGTLLMLVDPCTASASYILNAPFAGIAATEKVASDGSTTLGCWTSGVFDLYAGEAIACGALVVLSGSNSIRKAAAADLISGSVVGKALEAADAFETINVAVGMY